MNIGIIGSSDGNGHPYSFSSIVNGFNAQILRDSEWRVIHDYLSRRDRNEIGIEGMRVTHVWSQTGSERQLIAAVAGIDHIVDSPQAMIGEVDAAIIARDDWQSHLEIALPFLEAGVPLFIDKPLTLDIKALRVFMPYLKSGKLMSGSGLRFAVELDDYRQRAATDKPAFINGLVINDWDRYAVHLLDAIFSAGAPDVTHITARDDGVFSAILATSDGRQIVLSCTGVKHKVFHLNFMFDSGQRSVELLDNFTAFRRTLMHFRDFVKAGTIAIPPDDTLMIMKILIAGRQSAELGRTVELAEIDL